MKKQTNKVSWCQSDVWQNLLITASHLHWSHRTTTHLPQSHPVDKCEPISPLCPQKVVLLLHRPVKNTKSSLPWNGFKSLSVFQLYFFLCLVIIRISNVLVLLHFCVQQNSNVVLVCCCLNFIFYTEFKRAWGAKENEREASINMWENVTCSNVDYLLLWWCVWILRAAGLLLFLNKAIFHTDLWMKILTDEANPLNCISQFRLLILSAKCP